MTQLIGDMMETMKLDSLNREIVGMLEMLVLVRIPTKHVNPRMRQLEMKRKEMTEVAVLMGYDEIKEEIKKKRMRKRWPRELQHSSQRR